MDINSAAWSGQERAQERGAKLILDQTALALRSLSLNHWIMPVFTAVICVMFSRWIPWERLAWWFGAVVLSTVPLAVVSYKFRRHQPAAARWRQWTTAACAAYIGFTLVWSSLTILLWAPHDNLNHMLVMLLLASTLAGSSALVSASKPLAIVAFSVYGAATVLAPLQEGGLIYNGMSLLALLYVFYLVHMWRQMYETARDMLLLRNDKNDLIVALAYAKAESDAACARAEAASVAKSQFLANMSHELRTPLNAILGFSEIISSSAQHGETGKHGEYADLIHYSGEHLLMLINDILDLAKIESGKLVLNEVELDLEHVIDDTELLVAPRAQAGECLLLKDISHPLPRILADERATRQVVLNLLSNAVKFTPAGGSVTAFARLEPDGQVAFGVSDTGVGIPQEDLANVFEKFGQGRHDVVTADKGTGLGLPIVKGLAEAHGGTVTLESRLREGTTVTVRYPVSRVRALELKATA